MQNRRSGKSKNANRKFEETKNWNIEKLKFEKLKNRKKLMIGKIAKSKNSNTGRSEKWKIKNQDVEKL